MAILVENGFEQLELGEPGDALNDAGADALIVASANGGYDALLMPGGVMNPDKLRMHLKAVEFVKSFFDQGKPVAVICHGPWTIIEAGERNENCFVAIIKDGSPQGGGRVGGSGSGRRSQSRLWQKTRRHTCV